MKAKRISQKAVKEDIVFTCDSVTGNYTFNAWTAEELGPVRRSVNGVRMREVMYLLGQAISEVLEKNNEQFKYL